MKIITYLLIVVLGLNYALAQNDTITSASGLKFVLTKAGKGEKAQKNSKVKVRFTGKFVNGKVFETTEDGGAPFKFVVGAKEVIPAWDEALLLMNKGSKAVIVVPPTLAYGTLGFKNPDNESTYLIPPNATLIYEIWLLDFK